MNQLKFEIGMLVGFIVAGFTGSFIGLWLALPTICLTMENMTKYTPECRAAIIAERKRNQ